MSKVKKIIEGGLEFVKDSAKQLGQTVSPDALVKQALGQQPKNEFSDYLKTVGKDMTPQEYEKKKNEYDIKAEKEKEEAKKIITAATPAHMRLPQKPKELRTYEKNLQDKEQQKAQQVEAAKKTPQPLMTPTSVQTRGMLGAKRRVQKGFEGLQKDTKAG